MKHNKLFKLFLILYSLLLIYHVARLQLGSWLEIASLAVGIIIATLAHMRRGYGTAIMLIAHMAIEWSEYARNGDNYSKNQIAFYGTHALMDFIFLWHEAGAHFPKFRSAIVCSVVILLAAIFAFYYQPESILPAGHSLKAGAAEMLVIGGILGCSFSHLFHKSKPA